MAKRSLPDPVEAVRETYEKLKLVRVDPDPKLAPCPYLRSDFVNLAGEKEVLRLRNYQKQGIHHLLRMNRLVLGDATGLGKTLETIVALAVMWQANPAYRVIVVTPKSAVRQWAGEVARFTTGIDTIVVQGGLAERKKAYEDFFNSPSERRVILLLNYHILVRDWKEGRVQPLKPDGQPDPKQPVKPGLLDAYTRAVPVLTAVLDEATAFKSMRTKTWETIRELSDRCTRVYGLTATLLKNRLEEGYSIFQAILPGLFGTKTSFLDTYCVTKLQPTSRGMKIPIIVGYKNLDLFRDRIDPFFLGRQKHVVEAELPVLTSITRECQLSAAEEAKYLEALNGILELGDGTIKDYEQHKAFVSLIFCQQVVDSLSLLKFNDGDVVDSHKVDTLSAKEAELVDLVTGDDLNNEKVIVYTRFESHVERLQKLLAAADVKSVRITGKESDAERQKAQKAFQNLDSPTKVVFITDAGSEAINLQAAKALIFFNSPWSWGAYLQILGRMIRIGSPHKGVLVYHLVASRQGYGDDDDGGTIDEHVLRLLRSKKNLIDKVLGEAAVGALEFTSEDSTTLELIRSLKGKKRARNT
jgi:SNF2 family DNA or RNA helicase